MIAVCQRKLPRQLAAAGETAATGDQLRDELTKWIRVSVLEDDVGHGRADDGVPPLRISTLGSRQAIRSPSPATSADNVRSGVSGSPVICLAAITVATIDDANNVLAQLNSGTSFADAARQFSTDTVIAEAGGIVRGQDGSECIEPATVNPAVIDGVARTLRSANRSPPSLDTFSAVLDAAPVRRTVARIEVADRQRGRVAGPARHARRRRRHLRRSPLRQVGS